MPFCPKCRYEYNPGVGGCPDCNEQLVAALPEEPSGEEDEVYDDWVQIGRLTSTQYAEMLIEALHTKDIPAILHSGAGHFGETGQMGLSSFRPVGGGYSLWVPREFADEADQEAEVILGELWQKSRLPGPGGL